MEDTVVFAANNFPTWSMSLASNDTKWQTFSTDYNTNYPQFAHAENEYYKQSDAELEETENKYW